MLALVTGGAGFIGSHLVLELLARGYEVQAVDALTSSYDPAVKRARAETIANAGAAFREEDLRTADLAPLVADADVVFHLAGQPGVRDSWGAGFAAYVEHNITATQRLLDASVAAGLRRFVFASSSSVYGDSASHPTPEDATLAPISPYGVTKASAEMLIAAYSGSAGLPAVILRYFTVYGPGQRPDMAFHRFIRAIIEGRPLEVFGDGEQSRDVTFVADAVEATIAAGEAEEAIGHTINVGGGSVVTLNECLRELSRIAGREVEIIYGEPQAGDARHTSADLRRAKELLAFAPSVSLQEGLRAHWESLARKETG